MDASVLKMAVLRKGTLMVSRCIAIQQRQRYASARLSIGVCKYMRGHLHCMHTYCAACGLHAYMS